MVTTRRKQRLAVISRIAAEPVPAAERGTAQRLAPEPDDARTDADRWDQALLQFAEAIALAIMAELQHPSADDGHAEGPA